MGAVGALVMAVARKRRPLRRWPGDGHDDEALLLRGLHPGRFEVFSLTFRAGWDGPRWVNLLSSLPGGQLWLL